MARTLVCDICKKPTDEITGKLFYTPLTPGNNKNAFHSRYSHHLDVGVCCSQRLFVSFNFTKRKTAQEYNDSRRKAKA